MVYQHTIHLDDTDAAGVVYFARLLSICHYAYEAAIAEAGVSLASLLAEAELALPIVEAQIRFLQPLYCGELITIEVTPKRLGESEFEVLYCVRRAGGDREGCENQNRPVSQASTRHVCINPKTRRRQDLGPTLVAWLGSSS
ncbi:acyl-CoA thioesterase [Sodalinema gerasimenkoae]|uniref:acyl-CoA thioesterase n=1 Tax=Sodalinema gerasimenkoae TaxID=2862348 RepID=UPI00135C6E6E|nr:thioesterase family protein [Sodalinema gerasimenkoae]